MDPLKILLVDDSKTARYKLRLALQEQGVEVQTAESAESALSQVKRLNPDAILMDHTMPGMTGLDALEILKGDDETSAIPVVMCSAHEDEAFAARAKRLGALGILPKSDPAETAKKLPGTLDQIRQNLASAFVSAAPAAPAAAPAQRPAERRHAAAQPRQTPAPAASQGQIDSMLARRLGTLEQELRAEIETRCLTLEQNIATSERILIHRIEQATAPTAKPGSEQTGPIAAEAARLAAKELPVLIEQRLDQARQHILQELQAETNGGQRGGGDEAIRKLRASQYVLSAAAALIGASIAVGVSFWLG